MRMTAEGLFANQSPRVSCGKLVLEPHNEQEARFLAELHIAMSFGGDVLVSPNGHDPSSMTFPRIRRNATSVGIATCPHGTKLNMFDCLRCHDELTREQQ